MFRKLLRKTHEYSLASLTIFVLVINTIVFFIPIFIIGMLKLIPISWWQKKTSQILNQMPPMWIWINTRFVDMSRKIKWEIEGVHNLKKHNWYFIMCNHQTWMDIPVLQKVFNYKIPTLKPFIKSGLRWVPFLGFAWWALDCPFMKRYSSDYLLKNPHKKDRDLKYTQKACEKFKSLPVSVLSFVEGTRFNPIKRERQSSPYQHLLRPKAGGVAYVLNNMGQTINNILDVTIFYPTHHKTLWDYLCGRIKKVKIVIREIKLPKEFANMNLHTNPAHRQAFYNWLNNVWYEKDLFIGKTLKLNHEIS